MKSQIKAIKDKTEEVFGKIETNNFYNIQDLGIQIETPTGFRPIRSFVEKEGELYIVQFENGAIIKCANNHFFMTPVGKVFASSLKVDDVVFTNKGTTTVSFVQATGETQKFYDIEVDSDEHVFLTADGILHHNTGKTQTVEDMLSAAGLKDGDGYFKITGSASPTGIYRILFDHRDSIILFDDSDSALLDQEGRNLFKAAADTKKVRKISWMKGGKQFINPDDFSDEDLEAGYLPRWFEFTGKIIFISNLPLTKLDPDGALSTRGYLFNVDPTNEEIYEFMGKIANKISLDVNYTLSLAARLEVVEVLKSRNIKDKSANLRSLVRGMNTRAAIEMQGGSASEWIKFVKVYA